MGTTTSAAPKRRVSSLTRERQRERYLELPEADRKAWSQKMHAARAAARARRAERLAEVEAKLDALGDEFKSYERGHPRRIEILFELRQLGEQRTTLKWGEGE